MGKTIASLANFEVDPTALIRTGEIVFLNDLRRNVRDLDADVFRVGHGSVEVEFFKVNGAEPCTLPGDDAVKQEFDEFREAVLVPTSPGKQILVPLMVIRVRSGSSFSGQTSQTTMV